MIRAIAFLLLASSALALPNDCAIIAIEKAHALQAQARLRKVNLWTRLLAVRFSDRKISHVYCAFQPRGNICVYDESGTLELHTTSRDPRVIAAMITAETWRPIASARFIN